MIRRGGRDECGYPPRVADIRSVLAVWSQVIKPGVFLVLALVFVAIVLGAFVPLTGEVFIDMGVWFAAFVALNVFLARVAMKRAPNDPERLSDAVFAQLGVFGAAPFGAVLLWSTLRTPAPELTVLGFGVVALGLGVWSAVRLAQFLFVR